MNVAANRLRDAIFFSSFPPSSYSMWCWRCWQLWDARQQLGKHESLTSLSASLLCVFGESGRDYEFCMNVAHIHPSAEKCLILGEKMCSEMLFNLLWRILIGLGDLNHIFNYCMFGHIEKKSLHSTGLCVCIYSGFCYCFVSLLNCWLIINQAVCVLVLRQQRIISERIVCSAVTDHSHDGLLRFVLAHKQKPQPVFVCALWFLCVHSRSSK